MRKLLTLAVACALVVTSCNLLKNVEDSESSTYFTRANGTASGKLVLEKTTGSIKLGSSGLDEVYDIQISKAGTNGPAKVNFKRKGSYNQSFFGWMSSDEKQITGYFVSGGQKLPFACSSVNNVVYSDIKQTSLDGTWNLRCNGTATGEMSIVGKEGKLQVGSSGNDKIEIVKKGTTGKSGALEIQFKRTGSYNQTFTTWVSTDKKQMAGFYVSGGKEYPFYAYKK